MSFFHKLLLTISMAVFLATAPSAAQLGGGLAGALSVPAPNPTVQAVSAPAGGLGGALSSVAIDQALPSGVPIPALGVDEPTLVTKLSQALQILQLALGLLNTLSKTGTVNIPGVGNVGTAVEGVLINALLKLALSVIPQVQQGAVGSALSGKIPQ